MLKRTLLLLIFTFYMFAMTACDQIFPTKPLELEYEPDPLPVGVSTDIMITYPDDGILEITWCDQNVEIIKGKDVVEVSELSIKGLKAGTAILKVNVTATAAGSEVRNASDERQYSKKIKVKVVDVD